MFDLIPWKRKQTDGGLSRGGHSLEGRMARLRDDFDSIAEKFFGNWANFMDNPFNSHWGWGVEIDDRDSEYVIQAEAPGFDANDFDIQVSGNQLTIRAEHRQEKKENDESSFSQRSLHRSLTVPVGTEVDQIEASYRNGVLELRLPKGEAAKAKRIAVKPK
jgi:HSP20 family protein